MQNSVRVGNVIVPTHQLLINLQTFCTPLLEYSGVEEFPVSARGSSFRIRYFGRYFQIFTKHQLNGLNSLSDIAFMNSDGEHFTVGGTHYSRDDPNSYSGDIAVRDVTDRVVASSISQHMFFEITDKTITPNPELVLVDIAYGFPFDKQLFAPGEMPDGTPYLEHICSRLQEVVLNKQTESDDKDILIFSRNESLEMDPNGMSGSPVFSICKSDEGFFLALRAMVLTSNGKIFRVVKAGNIVKLLENICAAEILSLKSKGSVGLRL